VVVVVEEEEEEEEEEEDEEDLSCHLRPMRHKFSKALCIIALYVGSKVLSI